ncbi:MAG: SDR family NAD(P)-dependent oxidoreductase [Pseudonocardiaceae bacterium]
MTNADGSTESRAVIITGGGTGIGRATAQAFANHGDRVLVVGRTKDTLTDTADGYPNIRTLAVDITKPDAASLVVSSALREFGRIDVLVNNAASAIPQTLADIDPALVDEQFAVNLRAPILLTQQALGALADTGGTVVNLSTAGSLGRRAWPGMSIYGASKVAMDFLTRTWAAELAPRGIRVVAIAPGVINSGMGERMGSTPEEYARFLEEIRTRIPNGRVGRPEEIAWWIVQLVQPHASYATGTVLAVDGGLSLV